jgi:hypothetical protein
MVDDLVVYAEHKLVNIDWEFFHKNHRVPLHQYKFQIDVELKPEIAEFVSFHNTEFLLTLVAHRAVPFDVFAATSPNSYT